MVTGGAGFIGSTFVHRFGRAEGPVVVADPMGAGAEFANLAGAPIADVLPPDRLLTELGSTRRWASLDAVVHLGAITDTANTDWAELRRVNLDYSVELIDRCDERGVPVVYASSAAVYGAAAECVEAPSNEVPLNLYGASKLAVDRYVRRRAERFRVPVVGLRFFNVYGVRERRKGSMASMPFRLAQELRTHGTATIFGSSHGLGPGLQARDFVHVDDVTEVIEWAVSSATGVSVLNVGTGRSRTFLELAEALVNRHPGGSLRFVEMPEELRVRYQAHTCADLTALRLAGCDTQFRDLDEGVDHLLEEFDGDPTQWNEGVAS